MPVNNAEWEWYALELDPKKPGEIQVIKDSFSMGMARKSSAYDLVIDKPDFVVIALSSGGIVPGVCFVRFAVRNET